MLEIAEIRDEIQRKIEKRKERWSSMRTFLKYFFLFILFIAPLWIIINLSFDFLFNDHDTLLGRGQITGTPAAVLDMLNHWIFPFGIVLLSIGATKCEKKKVFSATGKDIVDRSREFFVEGRILPAVKLFFLYKLKNKDIEKVKHLINYDFSLSSYPNLFGANLRWTVYEDLKNAGFICGEAKEKAVRKVGELEAR